jgi:hypothetical protein
MIIMNPWRRVLIDVSFLKLANDEIKKMNKGKVGAPFQHPRSYIEFVAFLKVGFKIPYRTVQGIVYGLSEYIRIEEMHFTHIGRRILKIKRILGEDLLSKKFSAQKVEAGLKVMLYNQVMSL